MSTEQISKLLEATKGDGFCLPSLQRVQMSNYINALHPVTFRQLLGELEYVKQASLTRQIRENNVFPS